ncbi:MAG: SPOR domain-containing protein [Steroidobacteraceae bacterium]
MIGASILVAIVVLVVPELLSGPKPAAPQAPKVQAITPQSTRTVTVDLATSKAAPSDAAPEISSPPASSAGAAPIAPVETPAPSPISAAHATWALQLGSFASRANADNLARQLKAQGFSVYVLSGGSGQNLRYRVRVGPLSDREAADRAAAQLKSLDHASTFVAPGS